MTVRELTAGSRVYAYLRDSGGANQERSVDEQRAAIERHVAALGWQIADWYVDAATASGDYAGRTAFDELLTACRRDPPPVDGVITYSASRLGRDEYDSQFYRLELRRRGVQVVSVVDAIPAGPFALVFEAFVDWKNRVFLDDMSRSVREGLRRNVVAGLAPGGTPPRGYRRESVEIGVRRDGRPRLAARWVVDEEVAPRVRAAFELAAAGVPYQQILAATGLFRSMYSLRSMLCNRSYLGLLKFGAEEFPGLPPLVDVETWEAVQARMTTRAEHARVARRITSRWLLSGLAVCAECGQLMWGDLDRRRQERYYRCKTAGCAGGRVRADAMERTVQYLVLAEVLTAETLARLLDELRAALHDPALAAEQAQVAAEIGGKRRAIGLLLDALEGGAGAETHQRLAQRERELAALEARRRLLQQRQTLGEIEIGPAAVAEIVAEMREQVTAEDYATARRALRSIVARVLVTRAGVRVEFGRADVSAVYSEVPPRGLAMIPAAWHAPIERPL